MHDHVKNLAKYTKISRTVCKSIKKIQEPKSEKDLIAILTATLAVTPTVMLAVTQLRFQQQHQMTLMMKGNRLNR
ncbi:hypothetical protein C2G38_2091196 [Gigaspora rosea]|uniref:Uncharacterized protein n=1 Tax=Gigaspora rosea TaxID=44941 RepID=A0A397V1R0_9GLOM|nr:hypothetical protein C2G38_2091196 [Gigaspora rosea]